MKFATYVALIGAAAAHQEHRPVEDFFHHMKSKAGKDMGIMKRWAEHAFGGAEKAAKDHKGDMHNFAKTAMHKLHELKDKTFTPHHHINNIKAQIPDEKLAAAKQLQVTESHLSEFGFKGINIGALLACIGEEDKAALVVDAAIQSFEDAYKTKNIEEAVAGALALYAGYQQAVQGIPACKAIPTTAFEKRLAAPMTEEKKKKVAEIIQGFMQGSGVGTFNFTALLECIYEADQAAEVMYVAVSQIIPEAIHDKQIMEGVVGAIFMYSAVETFMTQALPLCEQVDKKSDWSQFNANPKFTVSGEQCLMNGEDITKDLEEAYDSLANDEFFAFGEKMGSIAEKKPELFLF